MSVTDYISSINIPPSVVTIGTFDGVHIGHQKIISRLVKTGKDNDLKSIVLTFFPHPRMVLQTNPNIALLNTIAERETILMSLGLDQMVLQPFTEAFSNLSAKEFVSSILVEKLNAKHIIIGHDHRFGKNRSANVDDLRYFGKIFGFAVEEISAQEIEDVSVSSTKIRNALNRGDIATANAYLGYNYFLSGKVVRGKGLGKTIGYPTANVEVEDAYKLIPFDGVYVVKATVDHKELFGMMNIGTNPTVSGTDRTIEVHLFDFDRTIYGSQIKIEFLERLRDEQDLGSITRLKAQLQLDMDNAKSFLKNHG
ncbi:MAG TPA: bifunctional riboflavin kinase/FAD synthetase [Aquaticitalea sp.]|nr:bifunctional riboflavin kinase/FAD synthetase [Aquaticitalea sp.]HNU59200.1 bifunctional riboflavin kinase/FAD synthetase [Aquaticitalea sp.]